MSVRIRSPLFPVGFAKVLLSSWLVYPAAFAIVVTSVLLLQRRKVRLSRLLSQKHISPSINIAPERSASEVPIEGESEKVDEMKSETSTVENTAPEDAVAATDSLAQSLWSVGAMQRTEIVRIRKHAVRQRLAFISSIILLMLGIASLFESVVLSSSVFALIGLGLTFWGFLFIFVRPSGYARSELVDSTALSSIQTIDRIVYEMGLHGKGIYVPGQGREGVRLFVPAEKDVIVPPNDLTEDSVFHSNPKGLVMVPPGLELAKFFFERLSGRKGPLTIKRLQRELPSLLTSDLDIMEAFEIKVDGNKVLTRSVNSLYSDFCDEIRLKTRVCSAFGCPICSSVGCLLVAATSRPVMLENEESSSDGRTNTVVYTILGPLPAAARETTPLAQARYRKLAYAKS